MWLWRGGDDAPSARCQPSLRPTGGGGSVSKGGSWGVVKRCKKWCRPGREQGENTPVGAIASVAWLGVPCRAQASGKRVAGHRRRTGDARGIGGTGRSDRGPHAAVRAGGANEWAAHQRR
jgi:hypothetical protein